MSPKIAFYPCCARDIEEPLELLSGIVDVFYFCDLSRTLNSYGKSVTGGIGPNVPESKFLSMDAFDAISRIDHIDIFFYRGDSGGEGGSGLYFLSKRYLPKILEKFPPEGGLIITDGSNSGGHLFKKMIRPMGCTLSRWHMQLTDEQRFLEHYGLWTLKVSVLESTKSHK